MKRCKHVEYYDGFPHDLEETAEKNHYKLKEVGGRIDFCESTKDSLIIKLSNHLNPLETKGKEIIWNFEKEMPLPAICGQGLRCFYKETHLRGDIEEIDIDAYELLDKPNSGFVIRRAPGAKPGGCKFVDE